MDTAIGSTGVAIGAEIGATTDEATGGIITELVLATVDAIAIGMALAAPPE